MTVTRKRLISTVTALLVSFGAGAYSFPLVERGVKREGWEYKLYVLKSEKPSVCDKLCQLDPNCAAWRFVKGGVEEERPRCYLLRAIPDPQADSCCTSGIKPAYLFKRMEIREPWGKYFKVLVCNPLNIPGSKELFGWKEEPQELGEAAPPKGAEGILYLAPPNNREPAVVEGNLLVPPKGGKLLIRTAGNVNSSYRLVVEVNGEQVFSGEIDGSRWREVEIDLSKWKGHRVTIDLLGYPMGWFYNYIFIDRVTLE